MIVKINARGTSFKGLATYLTHDPKSQTDERVGWTHTLNLAHDHVPSAVDEMMQTARNAELLKQEADIRAGGRAAENMVIHASLNWSPDDKPTREHMLETTESFVKHMGWSERQAIIVSHTDKEFSHTHLVVNAIHPLTGLCLDDSFEHKRAQKWALAYEREQGRIHCEQRLLDSEEREDAPTRPAWMAFKEKQFEFDNSEKMRRDQEPILIRDAEMPENTNDKEWKTLKQAQRDARMDFFTDGKSAFSELRSSIYGEVRDEFRERWSDFYAAGKNGADEDALTKMKAELVADQKAVLDGRRDAACDELRASRDSQYRELLNDQREDRLGLRWRQEAGFENSLFLEKLEDRSGRHDTAEAFRDAAEKAAGRQDHEMWSPDFPDFNGRSERGTSGMRSEVDMGANLSAGIGFGLLSIFESVADGIIGSKPAARPQPPDPDPPSQNAFSAAADDARRRQQQEQEQADEENRRRQRSLAGE